MTIKDGAGSWQASAVDGLPFAGYEALSGPAALRQRLLTVDEDGVAALLRYERRHANRVQMVEVLERRLASLRTWPAASSLARKRRHRRRLLRRLDERRVGTE